MNKEKPCQVSSQAELGILAETSDEEFIFRYLQKEDYTRGFLETLKNLTEVGEISQVDFEAQFDEMFTERSDMYKVVVIYDIN